MKIKKFICRQCGAPKINAYLSPYIVCDFCGSFTDIDFAIGMEAWNKDPNRTEKYTLAKIEFEQKLAQLLGKGDKENYQRVQSEYWDLYYKIYPEYLPPSVDSDEKYHLYLEVCAVSSTESAFDPYWAKKAGEQALLQQSVTYYAKDGVTYAESIPFFNLTEFYIGYIKESFRDFYSNAQFSVMHELLPPDIHLKMKLSMYVQAWLPYLTKEDAEKLLSLTDFSYEYTDIGQPEGEKQDCQFCKKELFIPKGSWKVYCESCHKINAVNTIFNCISCGTANSVPENPAKPVNCKNCGTENRLIQGWL